MIILGLMIVIIGMAEMTMFIEKNQHTKEWQTWVFFSLYAYWALRVLANYFRLMFNGASVACYLGALVGLCFVLSSISDDENSIALWISVGGICAITSHAFVFLKSHRIYPHEVTQYNGEFTLFNSPNGHNKSCDYLLLGFSLFIFISLLILFIFSNGGTGIIKPNLVFVVLYDVLITTHWFVLVLTTNFHFIDVIHKRIKR